MNKTLKIYIAGPMTGLVDANRHAFNGHASTLPRWPRLAMCH